MSIPPLPQGVANRRVTRVANGLHSIAVRLLRRARVDDRRSGLTPERLSLLSVLVFAGACTVGELAEAELVSAPAVSRSLKALEAAGYVRRAVSGRDRRRVIVVATPAGRDLLERSRRRRVERLAEELAGLSPAKLAVIARAVAVLQERE
jgi:DNA-binding MarR family transcriptional regulator